MGVCHLISHDSCNPEGNVRRNTPLWFLSPRVNKPEPPFNDNYRSDSQAGQRNYRIAFFCFSAPSKQSHNHSRGHPRSQSFPNYVSSRMTKILNLSCITRRQITISFHPHPLQAIQRGLMGAGVEVNFTANGFSFSVTVNSPEKQRNVLC